MKTPQAHPKKQQRSRSVGFVAAENIIDVRLPNYDHDNIAIEAAELLHNPRGWNTRSIGGLVRKRLTLKSRPRGIPSFAAIHKALATVR